MLSRVLIKNNKGEFENFRSSASENEFINSYEIIRPLPETIGHGYFSTISLNKGLELGISRCRFEEDYTAGITSTTPLFFFVFCMKGHILSRNSGRPEPLENAPGRSYAYFFEDPFFERKTRGRQEQLAVAVRVSPDFLMQLLNPVNQEEGQYRDKIQKILVSPRFYADHVMTTRMKGVFYQILNNPHKGRIGRIFLESKALELIALKLEQVCRPVDSPKIPGPMSSKDRDRIYRARDLLIGKLRYPPSLKELADKVGMSHTRLNRGFKMFYGCTVFEYLRKERLSYARMLMEENPVDLTWIAFESGFCSSSHFAASFHKEYGIRPSDYRKSLS